MTGTVDLRTPLTSFSHRSTCIPAYPNSVTPLTLQLHTTEQNDTFANVQILLVVGLEFIRLLVVYAYQAYG